MEPVIGNFITIVGPLPDLELLASDLAGKYGINASLAGRRVTCSIWTIGRPSLDLVGLLSANPRVTVGHLWWTEDGEENGCGIWVLGTTEFDWWGEGMSLVDEEDYDCWEDAVEAEAHGQHAATIESFLGPAELPGPGTG